MADLVVLPDLRSWPEPVVPVRPDGWFVLANPGNNVSVPTLDDARRCARPTVDPDAIDPCKLRLISIDPPHDTVIVGRGPDDVVVVEVTVTPGLPDDETLTLLVTPVPPNTGPTVAIEGEVIDSCRTRVRFEWSVPETGGAAVADGTYELAILGLEEDAVHVVLASDSDPPALAADPCALMLAPGSRPAGISVTAPPASFPRPPELAVDSKGCVVPAWSVNASGNVIRPVGDDAIQVLLRCSGGLLAEIQLSAPIRDAIFWGDVIAVATSSEIRLFDRFGCPLAPAPFVSGLDQVVALGTTDQGFLLVVQAGPGTAPTAGTVLVFRRDGTQLLSPRIFDSRGFYARHRNAAIVFDLVTCVYRVDPSRVSDGCCATDARDLTDDESLFFRLIDDLRGLRERVAFPQSGRVVIGPGFEQDPLDALRPALQWHRLLLFGEIPKGCAVRIRTRAFDDLVAGDPLVQTGWSDPVAATVDNQVPVRAPGDERRAAVDAMVLARPGRFLWIELTLLSDRVHTPRITRIEVERPRLGIARFLPAVYQNSTTSDDFLRRWLALVENTAFDGIALRMDQYAELFDPRTAPQEMLPFLAAWLEVLELARLRNDPDEFRRVLIRANELAETRGTVDGLVLAVKLYLGIDVQIVEAFKTRSGFILDAGVTIDDTTGAVLGCQTTLTAEPSPTYLGDEPLLGCSFLVDCEARAGAVPSEFEVIVPAHQVCSDADLASLRLVLDTEKPAHTRYRIRVAARAGFTLGQESVLGRVTGPGFDRNELDPGTFGILLLNGPGRPRPVGRGFALGRDSRLVARQGQPSLRVGFRLGTDSRVGA